MNLFVVIPLAIVMLLGDIEAYGVIFMAFVFSVLNFSSIFDGELSGVNLLQLRIIFILNATDTFTILKLIYHISVIIVLLHFIYE